MALTHTRSASLFKEDGSSAAVEELKSTSGAAHTNQQGGIWDYGTWPALYYEPLPAALTASASGTTVFQSNFITGFNGLVVEVVAIGGTTPKLSIYPSIDGTNIAATALGWVNLQTGAVISGATGLTVVGIYALLTPGDAKTKYSSLKMVQTGGAADQTCTLRYAHVWA